jgi:hypothetical protein
MTESYQLILDITKSNDEPYSFLYNIFECYNLEFFKKIINTNITTNIENELKLFISIHKLDISKLQTKMSEFNLRLYLNKFMNNEMGLRYIKSNNYYDINVEFISLNDKIIGIKLNNYYYIDKKLINSEEEINFDKRYVSEWCKDSFMNIIKNNIVKNDDLVYINNVIINYEKFFNKMIKQTNLDILPYANLYNSLILRYDITKGDLIKTYTFLPVSRYTCKNLFIKYQSIFQIFLPKESTPSENLITFNNPKNDKFFNKVDLEYKETGMLLSLRLYCSKMNNLESIFYRKTTETLDLSIKIIVKRNFIIGVQFGKINYYIWKNEGDISTYDKYDAKNPNLLDYVANIKKDACIFYMKLAN